MTLKVCMDIESEIGEDGGEALTTSNCKQYIDRCLLPVLLVEAGLDRIYRQC